MRPRPPASSRPASSRPPESGAALSLEELAAAAGISALQVARLMSLGLLDPAEDGRSFAAAEVPRLRRMLRLRADLGIDFVSAAIVIDLVGRLDRAMEELAALRRHSL